MDPTDQPPKLERARRVIKRYSNRKLYDTRDSRYVTLLQIAGMVRAGEDVQIIDNSTKEDKTEVTLALIISEELKSQPRSVPLGTLRDLIHQRGEKLLSQLRDGPIGRLIPGAAPVEPRPADDPPQEARAATGEPSELEAADPGHGDASSREKVHGEAERGAPSAGVQAEGPPGRAPRARPPGDEPSAREQGRRALDERIRAILPNLVGLGDLQLKIEQLTKRVEALEAALARLKPPAP